MILGFSNCDVLCVRWNICFCTYFPQLFEIATATCRVILLKSRPALLCLNTVLSKWCDLINKILEKVKRNLKNRKLWSPTVHPLSFYCGKRQKPTHTAEKNTEVFVDSYGVIWLQAYFPHISSFSIYVRARTFHERSFCFPVRTLRPQSQIQYEPSMQFKSHSIYHPIFSSWALGSLGHSLVFTPPPKKSLVFILRFMFSPGIAHENTENSVSIHLILDPVCPLSIQTT